MENECDIVRDLIPLYVENITSKASSEFVEHHIENCSECCSELEQTKAQSVSSGEEMDIEPLKLIKRKLNIRKKRIIVATAALLLAIVISMFGYLTTPKYYQYEHDLMKVTEAEGKLIITFDERVTNYRIEEYTEPDTNNSYYTVEAWSTIWDGILKTGTTNIIVEAIPLKPIYYLQNHNNMGKYCEDVLIYGNDDSGGRAITLPRLTLGYYVLIAGVFLIITLLVLLIVMLLSKRRKDYIEWIKRIVLLPIAYIIAHVSVLGLKTTTYSMERDLCLIALIAILLYTSALIVLNSIKARSESKRR